VIATGRPDLPGAHIAHPGLDGVSHRASSIIATQLYNAKKPLTLFELQAWLGHRSPESTQHYAKITPNNLAKAYNDAGYFARNVRTIEVLVDRDAATSALPPLVSLGSTTTSATGSAATPSSSNARTAWPALAATSTFPKSPAKANSCRRKRIFSGCSSASRSPTMNK
jgi:hypothetical protein